MGEMERLVSDSRQGKDLAYLAELATWGNRQNSLEILRFNLNSLKYCIFIIFSNYG